MRQYYLCRCTRKQSGCSFECILVKEGNKVSNFRTKHACEDNPQFELPDSETYGTCSDIKTGRAGNSEYCKCLRKEITEGEVLTLLL